MASRVLTLLNRSRLALSFGLSVPAVIGTVKLFSLPLYYVMHPWEAAAIVIVVSLALLALWKFNIE